MAAHAQYLSRQEGWLLNQLIFGSASLLSFFAAQNLSSKNEGIG